MIDYHSALVSALETVLPTHYEMVLTSKTKTPCISWMETNNYVDFNGSTLGTSRIQYQVKVWARDIDSIGKYALQVDEVLRPLGFTRSASTDLYDNESIMIQRILTYDALALESFED